MKKVVTVTLDLASQSALKKSGYALCFAKKVNDTYNVVWQSYSKYLTSNKLFWTPEYEVFGTNTYEEAIPVEAATNVVAIETGQKCTLSKEGIMGNAVTGGSATGITIENQYGPIHPGISQRCSLGGEARYAPIYVSRDQRTAGSIELTPKENVMIWFQSDVETSTIFEEARSNSIEIDLTNLDFRTVSYNFETGKWTIVA